MPPRWRSRRANGAAVSLQFPHGHLILLCEPSSECTIVFPAQITAWRTVTPSLADSLLRISPNGLTARIMETWRIVPDYDRSREQTGLIANESRVSDMLEAGRKLSGSETILPRQSGSIQLESAS